jgi:hypothetical protein
VSDAWGGDRSDMTVALVRLGLLCVSICGSRMYCASPALHS